MTKTEICNRALALLGHDRAITDYEDASDASTEAVRCRQFLDAAVQDVLSAHDWDFAAEETTVCAAPTDARGFARLPVPADMLRFVSATDAMGNPLEVRRNRDHLSVRTCGAECTLRYVSRDVTPDVFPHKFTEAVVARLAFLLAGPMFGNDAKTDNFYQLSCSRTAEAVQAESEETAFRGKWENPLTKARR